MDPDPYYYKRFKEISEKKFNIVYFYDLLFDNTLFFIDLKNVEVGSGFVID
jgi:hypothetical protein